MCLFRSLTPFRLALVLLGLIHAVTRTVAQEAAMFRGDAAHTGIYQSIAPEHLHVKWVFRTGELIVSSPAVATGTVYVGSADNFLYAIDAKTGKQKWKFDAHGNVSSPAVSDGRVYIVSLDGKLYAVDASTGAAKWNFATQGESRSTAPGVDGASPAHELMPDPWDFFLSAPTVANGVIYFGSGDHSIYAIEASSGKLRWKFLTGNVVHASPAVADGMVYVGSFDSYFYALTAADGTLAWKFKTGDDDKTHVMTGLPGSAAVSDGTVYFGSRDGNVYALDARSGALRWRTAEEGSWVIASPAVRDHRVYVTTSDTHKFQILDAATGHELSSLSTNVFVFSSPAIAGDHAYFGGFDGVFHDVDLSKQTYAGSFIVPGCEENRKRYLDEKGEIKNDSVWIGDTLEDSVVSIRTKLFSLGSILSSPVIQDGVIYFGSVDGSVYALGR
jgi:outer membrane protein assembly factor BamB